MTDKATHKHNRSKFTRVRADSLAIHPTAQRALLPAVLKSRFAVLDLDAIGVLHVVEYPINRVTKLWIIDGQHRWTKLMEEGCGEWLVDIKIHLDVKDDARASELFLKLNDRSAVSNFDKFQNALKAGSDDAIGVNDIALKHGTKIGRTTGDGIIAGISHFLSAYRLDAGKSAEKALATIVGAWGKQASSLEGKAIKGVALVYNRFNGAIEESALVKKLAKYPGGASALIGDAKGLMEFRKVSLTRCIAERVIDTYNSGRSSGRLGPL